jgi:hypothetical protein
MRQRGRLHGTALAFTVVVTGSAGAQPSMNELRAFRPEADTYVSSARPEMNFGRSPSLRADGSPRETAFLRFRLKALRGRIASVTLLLHAQVGARSGYQVRSVFEDEWSERSLTFESAPRVSLRYVSSKPVRRGMWSAVDVTSFVTNETSLVSLAVTTRSARGFVFESRESDQSPRLVVRARKNGAKGKLRPRP